MNQEELKNKAHQLREELRVPLSKTKYQVFEAKSKKFIQVLSEIKCSICNKQFSDPYYGVDFICTDCGKNRYDNYIALSRYEHTGPFGKLFHKYFLEKVTPLYGGLDKVVTIPHRKFEDLLIKELGIFNNALLDVIFDKSIELRGE